MAKIFLFSGSAAAFLGVALGAFGAHALKSKLAAEMLAIYQTGVHYHLVHALGLILVGILAERTGNSALVSWAGWLLLAGIIIFSGSLYALSISGVRALGAITPIGGLSFLAGWALLAVAALRQF
ncbi:MAG: DUF423 domain-containing protein [Calditrichaceae bacterium]|nr:DUF423 domain-containing protein [Calditrichia bacterium]NUQ43095.1 DUF423 domain-containing protein [Calditrichaceae bacterium]